MKIHVFALSDIILSSPLETHFSSEMQDGSVCGVGVGCFGNTETQQYSEERISNSEAICLRRIVFKHTLEEVFYRAVKQEGLHFRRVQSCHREYHHHQDGSLLAWDIGVQRLMVETIYLINGVMLRIVMCHISALCKREWSVNIIRVFREANQSADYMANFRLQTKTGLI